jgi:hypothetical protein
MAEKSLLSVERVLQGVDDALRDLVTADAALLELSAHELAIVHRFAFYLETGLRTELEKRGLSVDLDYDRHGFVQKWLPERPDRDGDRRFRPDLVIHRRLDDSDNLLVVEWKKHASSTTIGVLKERLQALMSDADGESDFRYQIGVIIVSDDVGVRWLALDRFRTIQDWKHLSRPGE